MALTITLKPNERAILGGAVVRNPGLHSVRLVVETPVPVLRQADVLKESDARTPCSRLYLTVQLLYLEPDRAELQRNFLELAKDVLQAAPSLSRLLEEISLHVASGDCYRALQIAKQLRQEEQTLLGPQVATGT